MKQFKAGQVVMVNNRYAIYPMKLVKRTPRIHPDGPAWFDTLGCVEPEAKMRPLTARECGRKR